MKVDKQIKTRAGVIWAIISVVVSALLVIVAFSIDDLTNEVRFLAIAMLGCALISLFLNLKKKKYINVKSRLDD